jgi:hypothetical protein
MKAKKKPLYTVVMQHNSGAEPRLKTVDDYEKAAKIAHEFFLDYDFRFEDGKLCDDGNDGGDSTFENVKIYKNKYVVSFIHFGGEGPCCRIEKTGSL